MELQIFNNQEFGQIRTITENGKPLFCGSDVAKALGYSNVRDAVGRHCKGVVKRDTLTEGGAQEMSFITESDVYRLIVRSHLPSAERFESWVFDEVLPAIRQHGGYLTPQMVEQVLADPDTIIKLATQLKQARREAERMAVTIEANRPKVLFAESVEASYTSILVGDLAKLLRQNGVDMGQQRMFDWLRKNGYLIRQQGSSWNMPTQRAMEMGLFEIKERTINNPDGSTRITRTPKVTGKGQIYFINKLRSGNTLARVAQ